MIKEQELESFRNTQKYQEYIKVTIPISSKVRDLMLCKAEIEDNLKPLRRRVKEMETRTKEIDEQIKYLQEE